MTRRRGNHGPDCPPPGRRTAGRSVERRREPPARLADQRIGRTAAVELADDQRAHVVVRQRGQQQLERAARPRRRRARRAPRCTCPAVGEADPRPQAVGLEAVLDRLRARPRAASSSSRAISIRASATAASARPGSSASAARSDASSPAAASSSASLGTSASKKRCTTGRGCAPTNSVDDARRRGTP